MGEFLRLGRDAVHERSKALELIGPVSPHIFRGANRIVLNVEDKQIYCHADHSNPFDSIPLDQQQPMLMVEKKGNIGSDRIRLVCPDEGCDSTLTISREFLLKTR